MSDVIPKPGKYKQQNGKPAEVKWVGEGKALGFDSTGEEALWDAATGKQPGRVPDDFYFHITGPWPPDPPAKPFRISDHGPGVYETRDGREAQVTERGRGQTYPWEGFIDIGERFNKSWKDCGSWHGEPRGEDLVRYLRPLPKPAVDPGEGWRLLGNEEVVDITADEVAYEKYGLIWIRAEQPLWHGKSVAEIRDMETSWKDAFFSRRVVPKPEWTPTNELRWRMSDSGWHPTGTRTVESRIIGQEPNKRWIVLEQKWTNGTDSEWRPVPVEGA